MYLLILKESLLNNFYYLSGISLNIKKWRMCRINMLSIISLNKLVILIQLIKLLLTNFISNC